MDLLNHVNVKQTYFPYDTAELYIAESKRISKTLVDNIRKTHVFDRVVYLPYAHYRQRPKIVQPLSILRFAYDTWHLILWLVETKKILNNSIANRNYSHIFIHGFQIYHGIVLLNTLQKNQQIPTISIVEEGACDLYKSTKSLLYLPSLEAKLKDIILGIMMFNLPRRDRILDSINQIYLYCPSNYTSDTNLPSSPIPKISLETTVSHLLSSEIEDIDVSEYRLRKYYYFSSVSVFQQPDELHDQMSTILSIIPKNQLLIKDHPRFHEMGSENIYRRYQPDVYVDCRNYLLEAVYQEIDLENKVFMSDGSATILHPKYMFGKEPYVIFTYNLTNKKPRVMHDKMAADLIATYNDKSKVYIPKSKDDLKKSIMEIEMKR